MPLLLKPPPGLQLFILTESIFTNALNCKEISFGDNGSFEHHAILFKCQAPVLAITLYRPPKHCPTFFTNPSELLYIFLENYDKIIVFGNFNIHVEKETDSKAIEFMDLLSSMDFIQHVTGPIHNHGHTLDVVITKGNSIDISFIGDVALSGHHCVYFITLLPIVQGNTEGIIKKHYLTSDVATDFIERMNNTPSPILCSRCDDLVDNFNSN